MAQITSVRSALWTGRPGRDWPPSSENRGEEKRESVEICPKRITMLGTHASPNS